MSGWIVERSLNFEADEIFNMNYWQAHTTDKFQSLGAIKHAEGWAAEGMEKIDAAKRGVGSQVMRNVF